VQAAVAGPAEDWQTPADCQAVVDDMPSSRAVAAVLLDIFANVVMTDAAAFAVAPDIDATAVFFAAVRHHWNEIRIDQFHS